MKIAFIVPSLTFSGPNIYTQILIQSLRSFFEDVEIVVFYCRPSVGIKFPAEVRLLSSFQLKESKSFDFVFSTMFRSDLWLAFGWHMIPRARRVSVIHNLIYEDLDYLYGRNSVKSCTLKIIWSLALRRIGQLIVSSPFMRLYYAKILGPVARINIIPYGIPDVLQNGLHSSIKQYAIGESFILISCGNLINRKNFAAVIRALPLMPGVHFRLIGSGPELEKLQLLALQLGVADRVEFLGFRENLAPHYHEAHCYVMPSLSEGYGLALIEAMRLGLPVICSDLLIYKDMLPQEDVPRFSPEDIATLVTAVSLVRNDQKKFSRQSRQIYQKLHKIELLAEKYYDFINSNRS